VIGGFIILLYRKKNKLIGGHIHGQSATTFSYSFLPIYTPPQPPPIPSPTPTNLKTQKNQPQANGIAGL